MWRTLDHFLLRRAGYSLGLLAAVGYGPAWALAELAAEAADRAETLRGELLGSAFPAEVVVLARRGDRASLQALSRLRRDVGRRAAAGPPPAACSSAFAAAYECWRQSAERAAGAEAGAAASAEAERGRCGAALRGIAAREDIREAIFLMSPSFSESVERWLGRGGPAAPSSFENRLFLFCQRLAAKNETNSSFGPLTYGRVGGPSGELSLGPELEGGVAHRRGFCAFWAVAALSDGASRDPALRDHLPVRRVPVTWVEDGQAHLADGRVEALGAELVALYRAVDGHGPGAEVVARAGLPASASTGLRRLERLGLVRRDLEPASTSDDPLGDFLERLPDVPAAGPWRDAGERLGQCVTRFGAGSRERRVEALAEAERTFMAATGRAPRRRPGQAYADRTLLYEDCLGDGHPCLLPAAEAERFAAELGPVMDLGAAYGALVHAAHRACAGEVVRELGGRARYLAFAGALADRTAAGGLEPHLAPAHRLAEALARLVQERSDGRTARLRPEETALLGAAPSGPLFASPDVMLERRPGAAPRLVIGEVHPYVYAWGSQGLFAPDPAAMQAAFAADLRPWGGPRLAHVLRRRSHKGLVTSCFPGRFIEVSGRSGDGARALAIGDLWVEDSEAGPRLLGPDGPLVLYTGEGDHPHLKAFAAPGVEMPPLRLGRHTPRVEMGQVVVQRERWDLQPDDLDDIVRARTQAQLLLAVARERRRRSWPRRTFVRSPSEPKPLYIDLEIPYAQEALRRLAATGPVGLVEMLPDEPDLWVLRGDGRYTSELRLALIGGRDAG